MANTKIEREFVRAFGQTPDIIAAAPGRVNLIGEHIDYSDGYVLPFAIADRTYAAISKRSDNLIRIASVQRKNSIITHTVEEIQPKLKGSWERYVLSVIWAMEIKHGVDVMIDGHVPLGAGLSSSAALECSVAMALNDLFSCGFDLESLARLTQRGENEYVGVPCGIMDQSVSLMAKSGSALLLDCRDLTSRNVAFDVASHGLELLIIDSKAHHSLTDGGYAERRASCERVVSKLSIRSMRELTLEQLENSSDRLTEIEFIRARHAVTEIERVLNAVVALEAKNFNLLGELLNSSHASLRDDYAVSCPELNTAVDASLATGALGSRMVGGGFGGSAIALIEAKNTQATIQAVESAFSKNRFKAPRFFTSLPSQGAEIIKRGL